MKRRWSIFDEFEDMIDRFNKAFESFSTESDFREPETEITETEGEIIVTMELPGVEKREIDLKVTKDQVIVKAEHRVERNEKGTYRKIYKDFYKAISLPKEINPDKVKATYKNGILEIRLPKKVKDRGKRIKVE